MSVRIHSSSVRSGSGISWNVAQASRRSATSHAGSWRSARNDSNDLGVKSVASVGRVTMVFEL